MTKKVSATGPVRRAPVEQPPVLRPTRNRIWRIDPDCLDGAAVCAFKHTRFKILRPLDPLQGILGLAAVAFEMAGPNIVVTEQQFTVGHFKTLPGWFALNHRMIHK
jgi:hypothetical protein